ncbi:MAG: hypothetical protein ABI305_02510 [Tepidiformaceae bacterium]
MTRRFVSDRPKDPRTVCEQLSRLVDWGKELQRRYSSDAERYEWIQARLEVIEWARYVSAKVDAAFEARILWQPPTNPLRNIDRMFDASVAATEVIRTRICVWADKLEILDEPSPEFVLLDANTPFSSWKRIGELVATAATEVWAADPYITDDALPLFLKVASAATVRLLTREDQTPTPAGWKKFCGERGGTSKVHLGSKDQMFHDRFFGVDDRVFLSGASLKDVGKRFSVLTQLDDAAHAAYVRAKFEALWASSPANS